MQKNKAHVLSTASLSRELVNKGATLNIIIDEIPFIKIKFIHNKKVKEITGRYIKQNIVAIFTSTNAVSAVAKLLEQPPCWKIYCIGNATKNILIEHFGKDCIAGTAANAENLAKVIIKDQVHEAIFFCGDQRRDELPVKLKQHNVAVEEIVVYNTKETPVLVKKKYDGILFFSPSAAQSFFSLNEVDQRTQLFAIGSTTAKAIQQYHKNNVIIPRYPGKENMLKSIAEYYKEE